MVQKTLWIQKFNHLKGKIWHLPVVGPLLAKVKKRIDFMPLFYWSRFNNMLRTKTFLTGPPNSEIRRSSNVGGKGFRILFINHYFDQDIDAIIDANTRHQILVMPHHEIRFLAVKHFEKKMPFDFMRRYNDSDMVPLRNAYRKDLVKLVDTIYKFFPFDIVVATSVLLFWIRELMSEIQSRQIPFVMIDKEGTISPYFFNKFTDDIKRMGFVTCDHILVWSQSQAKFWELAGGKPETIHLIGQQRSDFWSKPEKWGKKDAMGLGLRNEAPLLVFYSFFKDAYIPKHLYDSGEVRWDRIFDDSHRVIFQIAKKYPRWDVVIKTHPQQIHDLPGIRNMIKEQSLPNVYLATGPQLSRNLNIHADVICGFQTTALIEAMIIRERPIIYLFWGDAQKWSDQILPFHNSGAVTVATSPDDLYQKLEKALNAPYSPLSPEQISKRKSFIDDYFWNPDGHVSERTLLKLEEIVQDSQRKMTKGQQPGI